MFTKTVSFSATQAKALVEAKEGDRRTIRKIEIASGGCHIGSAPGAAPNTTVFTISHSDSMDNCAIAAKYLELTVKVSAGLVTVNPNDHPTDLMVHCIPSVLGKCTVFMAGLEEEIGVICFGQDEMTVSEVKGNVLNPIGMGLMLATDGDIHLKKPNNGITGITTVAVFSSQVRNLVSFKFKLMQLTETKLKGLYTNFTGMDLTKVPQFHYTVSGVCVDTYPIAEEELSLALGKQGANRRRISAVSGCVVEYIGHCAFFYGDLASRQLARTLLTVILERGRGTFSVPRWRGMVGVVTVDFPTDQIGWITGKHGIGLQQVEASSNVICFVDSASPTEPKRGLVTLPLPLARHGGSAGFDFSTGLKSSSDAKATMIVLGKDADAKLASGLILERLSVRHQPVPVPATDDSTSQLFTKLFRGTNNRGSKISVSDTTLPSGQNKLHAAICELVTALKKHPNTTQAPLPDLTVMEVPSAFSAAATNSAALLKQIEDEYRVLCGSVQHGTESAFLVLVGQLRSRRAAELKIMATIESKQRGFYSQRTVRDSLRVCDRPWYVTTEGFDTDSYPIPEQNLSFALGNKGTIRKKLAVASGCVIEYVGEVAYLSGTLLERTRGRDYLKWVLQQLEGEVAVGDYARRTDVSSMQLSKRAAGFVNGNKGRALRTIEELTGTFCFIGRSNGDTKPLLVCGQDPGRTAAMFLLERYVTKHQTNDWSDDASDPSVVSEMSKSNLEQILKTNSLYTKPLDPWRCGSQEPGEYVWASQPCPAAARPDAVLAVEKSTVLLRTNSRKEKSPKGAAEFVNDASAFPELGGSSRKSSFNVVVKPAVPLPPVASVIITPPPPSPPSPKAGDEVRDAGIFIDREKGEIWGDWGLGPNGDADAANGSSVALGGAKWPGLTPSPQPKLMGAWK